MHHVSQGQAAEEKRNATRLFEDREKEFEAKYRHDQEVEFRIQNRRNKLLGLWAAEQLGLSDQHAAAYAKEVVMAGLEGTGSDRGALAKLRADLQARRAEAATARLDRQAAVLRAVAEEQVMGE